MKKLVTLLATFALLSLSLLTAQADEMTSSLVTKKSNYSVTETLDRLAGAVTNGGGVIFARVDHAAGAKKVGEDLRPTEMILFGNPKIGTPAMLASQTMGLDLPLRALAWEDESGQVFLSYHLPVLIGDPHGLKDDHAALQKLTGVMKKLEAVATQ
ncbi:DUF302 domain-containing protein [Kiloniella sp. b19]|uniref:DUF302 domain-containing protein n=1 Tax=Kiloniella sp. GXU_MW_B19 TaxID=3141326 RepID=UPI0031E1C50E